jgi:hypothetical protein
LRDLIKNDNNGFLIAPDHRLLADKMIDVQQNSSNALERANTAFSFASCEFSMPISVQKIMALYRS